MIPSSRIGGMTSICQWKAGTKTSRVKFQVRTLLKPVKTRFDFGMRSKTK